MNPLVAAQNFVSLTAHVSLWSWLIHALARNTKCPTFSTNRRNRSSDTSLFCVRRSPSAVQHILTRCHAAGAFSAYRYIALKNDALGMGPLASYFKGETLAGYDADVFVRANLSLLVWELTTCNRPPICTSPKIEFYVGNW